MIASSLLRREFAALIEAAADLEDLHSNRYFAPRGKALRTLQRGLRRYWIASTSRDGEKDCAALEAWVRNGHGSRLLRLRNRAKFPRWALELRRMLDRFPLVRSRERIPLAQRMVQPALAYSRTLVRSRLRRARLDHLPASARRSLETQLQRILVRTLEPCLRLHFQAFENAYRGLYPARGDPERAEIERAFVSQDVRARLITLLTAFPVLAKIWSQLIIDWEAKVCELAARLAKDRRAIAQVLFAGRDPGDLLGLTLNVSDPHHGGQETMLLRFRNGRLVYKPRSGRSEADWFAFLRWTGESGFTLPFRLPRLLPRGKYCWVEFIEHQPCQSQSEVRRYHRRAGALLCAAYMLRAVDCHRDNLIAARDQPVLIDAETLLHPSGAVTSGDECPLLRTGLLPVSSFASQARRLISAFGGTSRGKHTPTLDGELLRTSNYVADVLRGLLDMWDVIGPPGSRTHAAFQRRLRRLAGHPWRRVYLPTEQYLHIRRRSLRPEVLRSGLERSRAIACDLIRPGVCARIALTEISAIACLDVPHFLELPSPATVKPDYLPRSELLARVAAAFRA